MKTGLLNAVLALVFIPAFCGAQAITREDRGAVLKFGIESEVLDLVQSLQQEKNSEFRDLLIESYERARTDDLKQSLLTLFLNLKDAGLETLAVQEISQPDKKSNALLLNAVSYLSELKSAKSIDTFVSLSTGKNKVLAVASVRALGKLSAVDRVSDLLKQFQDAETDPNLKPDYVWAFGEMKAVAAVEILLKEYDENDSQPLLRRSILEALGKIGDDRAWERVQAALEDPNTDIRAAAIASSTAYIGKGDQVKILTSALRDSQVAVRMAGAQAAKALKSPELKDLLTYRIKKDPEAKVRIECLRALSNYADGASAVLSYLENRKTDYAVWREALNIALDQKYSGTIDALRKVLEGENADKNGVLSSVVAAAILPQKETYRALLGLVLVSDKPAARSTALRAIGLGKFTEFEGLLRSLEAKDPDAGVKLQARSILKDWGLITDLNGSAPKK